MVTALERKYADFDGLNLTWETLEGLVKHNGPLNGPHNAAVRRIAAGLSGWRDFMIDGWSCGEAQVAALADDIAYATHDIDDGLRAGLITIDDLRAGRRWRGRSSTRRRLPRRSAEPSRRQLRRQSPHDHVVDRRSRRRQSQPSRGTRAQPRRTTSATLVAP